MITITNNKEFDLIFDVKDDSELEKLIDDYIDGLEDSDIEIDELQ